MVETRGHAAPQSLVGQRIGIHAAKRQPSAEKDDWTDTEMRAVLQIVPWLGALPLGAILATAVLDSVVQVKWLSKDRDGERYCIDQNWQTHHVNTFGNYAVGRWLWILRDVERLEEPVEATGHQGFWNWTRENSTKRRRTS